MKRLKTILQCSFIYYFLIFICLISYVIDSNIDHVSVYDNFNEEKFIINNIVMKDYGVKLELKGKEKVIGFYYLDDEKKESFMNEYCLGDKVSISGDKNILTNNTVPYTFNYKKYLNSNGIYSSVNITEINKIASNKNIFYKIKNMMLNRGKKLDKSYPYISSLIFGNNNYLDEDVLSSYRENGISHLFAISGLHISIFILIISFICDKLKCNIFLKDIIFSFLYVFD